jgi:hypothetical protein
LTEAESVELIASFLGKLVNYETAARSIAKLT